jgi:hypothetical protein
LKFGALKTWKCRYISGSSDVSPAASRKPLFGGVKLDRVFFRLGGAAYEAEYGIVSLKRYRAKYRSAVARLDVTNIGRSEGSISWIKTAMAR